MVLRKKYGPSRVDVKGEGRKLHAEELNVLHNWLNITRVMAPGRRGWAVRVTCLGEKRNACRGFV
jgi:hypothetical protein